MLHALIAPRGAWTARSAIASEQATISAQLFVEKERAKTQMKERFQNRKSHGEKNLEQNDDDGVQ